ncbi:MAG TPA: penicillin-binding protein 2 [Solirubrobacterales bacterium]
MTSQFALRVAILGGAALVMFFIIFFRLWYLEVLSGDKYLEQAQNNRVREVKVQAPRGEIVDRNGEVLVGNRTALALQLKADELPANNQEEAQVIRRLADVTGTNADRIDKEIKEQTKLLPASPVTLERDVPYELVLYLQEHQDDFPGVSVERVYVRSYPKENLAAHIFGYVREVTPEQLKEPQYKRLDPGDGVGQTGVELAYDSQLRGQSGATRVQVDALGRPKGEPLSDEPPVPGNNLRLTIDSGLQETGEAAISQFGLPGAFVAMDVDSGEVLGLGSTPTFDPSIYSKPRIPQKTVDFLNSEETGAPQANRAIQGLYPTGSTYKLITATAALEEGLITPGEIVDDPGQYTVGGVTFRNAGDAVNGALDMRTALQVSSDVYFYKLGHEANTEQQPMPIQEWAGRLGLGSPTGIDLPSELSGLIPTPEWRNQLFKEGNTDRPWSAGDNINLSVGQGDLQATPLQMAVAYATVANQGLVPRPHLAQRVEDANGRVVQEVTPAPRRQLDMSPQTSSTILSGLEAAAMDPGGTSYPVFGGFPVEVAGKTGTAERPPHGDQSWYVALAPAKDPEIVVAATIEEGGFGADAAAPAVRQILEDYFDVKPGQVDQVGDDAAVVE